LKLSPDSRLKRTTCIALLLALILVGLASHARAELTSWLCNIEAGSPLEAVFFRLMALPNAQVLFRRPPSETRPALTELLRKQPDNGELYALRALEDEQQLDNVNAEADWKNYLSKSADKPGAELALADFYHRRLRPWEEIAALAVVAAAPATASEKFVPRRWANHAVSRLDRPLSPGTCLVFTIPRFSAGAKRVPRRESAD
jgi:hypothetical protein